jgi:hypothetical protein
MALDKVAVNHGCMTGPEGLGLASLLLGCCHIGAIGGFQRKVHVPSECDPRFAAPACGAFDDVHRARGIVVLRINDRRRRNDVKTKVRATTIECLIRNVKRVMVTLMPVEAKLLRVCGLYSKGSFYGQGAQ